MSCPTHVRIRELACWIHALGVLIGSGPAMCRSEASPGADGRCGLLTARWSGKVAAQRGAATMVRPLGIGVSSRLTRTVLPDGAVRSVRERTRLASATGTMISEAAAPGQ